MMIGAFNQDAYILFNQIPTASPTNVSHSAIQTQSCNVM